MGSPTPASSSTSTTPVGAQSYTPQFQPNADQMYFNLLKTLEQQYAGGPGQQTQDIINKYLTGYGQPGGLPYGGAEALAGAQGAAGQYGALAPLFGSADPRQLQAMAQHYAPLLARAGGQTAGQLSALGKQTANTAFDPQSALYNQELEQARQQANAAAAAGGLQGTPYGASTVADAVNQFNLNWQNNLLNRQIAGGQAAGADFQAAQAARAAGLTGAEALKQGAYQGAQTLAQTSDQARAALAGTPYGAGANIAGNAVQGEAARMAMPAQLLGGLESYLGLGQSAALTSGQLGQMGFNQQMQGLGGMIGGANALLGPYGLLSSGGVGPLSGLFGGGGGAGLFGGGGAAAVPAVVSGGTDVGALGLPPAAAVAAGAPLGS